MNRITSRLAARAGTRQIEAIIKADAAADSADRAITRLWSQVLALLRSTSNPWEAHHRTRHLFRDLAPTLHNTLSDSLTGIASWGHQSAVANLVRTLPRDYLALAAGRRFATLESRELREDLARDFAGIITLGIDAGGQLVARDRAAHLREPARQGMTIEEQYELFKRLLFPPPSMADLTRIVFGAFHGVRWDQRLAGVSRLASPEQMAGVIMAGYSQGKNQREIAKDLMPIVDNVRSAAKRIARTEGMRIAGEIQMDAHERLGSLCVGYQILATLDQHTRPAHRARNGQIFYKQPEVGQKGIDQMPRPPLESDGSLAWNCRCTLVPVLAPPSSLPKETGPVFTTAEDKLIPDPTIYADWWQQADDRRRRLAVGSRRYSVAKDVLGHTPRYEHLVDPQTGALLSLDRLRAESPADRLARVALVRGEMAQRRAEIRTVATWGSATAPERVLVPSG